MGAVLGIFTAARCSLAEGVGLDNAIGSAIAGGLAVGAATAVDRPRIEFLQAYFEDSVKALGRTGGRASFRASVPFAVGVSAVSGAVVLGGMDTLLRHWAPGLRW